MVQCDVIKSSTVIFSIYQLYLLGASPPPRVGKSSSLFMFGASFFLLELKLEGVLFVTAVYRAPGGTYFPVDLGTEISSFFGSGVATTGFSFFAFTKRRYKEKVF